MRKTISLLLALCLLLFSLPAFSEAVPGATPLPGYTLRDSADEVRVFATKSMKANIVGYIIPGGRQEVQVLSVSGDWCYIGFTSIHGMSYGYVPLSCFDVAAKPTPTPIPQPENSYPAGTAAWVQNREGGYRLNLREEPSVSSASIGKYYTGTPLTLTGNAQDGFVQVLLAGSALGWLDARYMTTDALSFVPEMPMVTVKNKGSGASLRSGPGTSYSRLGWYAHGTAVTVFGVRADGWYHVMVNDQVGYLSEGLLSGTFPYGYGMDSDNPTLSGSLSNGIMQLYINTRSSGGQLNLRKSAASSANPLAFFTPAPQ